MPTINKPFLLKLLLVLAAGGGLLVGANALQARRIPDALLRQAERKAEAGQFDAAAHYYRQYLEFKPADVDAQVRLVDVLKNRAPGGRTPSDLVFLYDKILRLDPDRDEVRRDALAMCLRLGRYTDAEPHAEELLKRAPNDPLLWQQLGAAQAGLNRLPEARTAYETAVRHAPDQMGGYQKLAQFVWRNQGDTPGARAVLDRMVAALPADPDARLVRARFETFAADEATRGMSAAADIDRAVADFQRVLELDPENADASLHLAEILQQGRNVPAAHALLRDAVNVYPKDLRLVRGLSWLELVRGNVPASIAVLEDGLRNVPEGFDLMVPLADLLVQQGDAARSEDLVRKLEARKAPPTQVTYLKARLAMRQARWADAQAMLESLRGEAVRLPGLDVQLNMLLAVCCEKVGDRAGQEATLRRVGNLDPANVPSRVALGNLYLSLGRSDEAVREFEAACQSAYATGAAHAQLIRTKLRGLKATNAPVEEWARLEQMVLKAAAKFTPTDPEPVVLRAEVLAAGGKRDAAVQLLRAESGRRPGDARLWATLAEATADAGGTAAGLAVVDEAQAAAGDGPDVRLARASLYARDPARVRPIEPLEARIEGWPDSDQLQLLAGLVEVYDRVGDRAGVVRTLRRITSRRPTDAAVWMRLYERATEAGDAPMAAEARGALGKLDGPGGVSALVCDALAAPATAAGDLAAKLTATTGAAPQRADVCLALAHLQHLLGDEAQALALAERAVTLEPSRFETNRALLLQAFRAGKPDRAAKEVARLAADPRWAGQPLRRLLGMVADKLPPADALAVLRTLPAHVRSEPGALGWAASLYTRQGNLPEADKLLKAATDAATATTDDWLRLALHRTNAGGEASRDALAAARTRLPEPAFFALAATFQETPKGADWRPETTTPAQKRTYAQARLAVKLSRSAQAGARDVLEEYLKDGGDLPATGLGWARRNLAMLLVVGGGGAAERRRAFELLVQSPDDAGATADDLRATAAVLTTLARYLEDDDRKATLARAAQALGAAAKAGGTPRDLFNLAQLYRVAGMPDESRQCLQKLLFSDPNNLYYLVAALETLTAGGDFATGGAFADRLRAAHPGDFRAVAAVARFEAKAGRPERCVALAEAYIRSADPTAGDFLTRSARVAELLDELARSPKVRGTPVARRMADAAVERYEALAPTRPEAVVAVAGLLAADGRTADAFAKIDQFAHYLPARTRTLAGMSALRGGSATGRQFETVRRWLDEQLAADPDSVSLRLTAAEFYALKQDLAAARTAYEWVLAKEPKNVTALNNLAWILAPDPRSTDAALALVDRATREVGVTGELLDTRARIRIAAKQYGQAAKDQKEALNQAPTPLRLFHVAVLRMSESPPQPAEARKFFRDARDGGLEPNGVHPADLPVYRVLEGLPDAKQ